MPSFQQLILSIASAIIIGLAGWVYSIGSRVAAVEASRAAMANEVHEIHQDVRELRKALLGR